MSKKYKGPIEYFYEKYSPEQHATEVELGGHAEKEFVRFYDPEHLKPFYRAIKKKGNNYRSIYNGVIMSGYNPQYVSVLKKTIDGSTGYRNENAEYDVAGCRLANMFGIPTVYNFIYTERNMGEYDIEFVDNTHLLSVDFVEHGTRIVDLHEAMKETADADWNSFDIEMDRNDVFSDLNLEGWFKFFDHLPQMRTDVPNEVFTKENIDKIKKDFIKMYFFRKYIIDDEDLEPRNVALIYNEKQKTISLAPSHDYDFSFKGYSHTAYKIFSEADLFFCMRQYPKELAQIIQGYGKLLKKYDQFLNDKDQLIDRDYCDIYTSLNKELGDRDAADEIAKTVIRNLKRMTSIYGIVKDSYEKSEGHEEM